MIKVLQTNCRASEDIMTALMSAAVRAGAEVVLIQEPSVKGEEDRWKAESRMEITFTSIGTMLRNHT
jgi:hypothetical protein